MTLHIVEFVLIGTSDPDGSVEDIVKMVHASDCKHDYTEQEMDNLMQEDLRNFEGRVFVNTRRDYPYR